MRCSWFYQKKKRYYLERRNRTRWLCLPCSAKLQLCNFSSLLKPPFHTEEHKGQTRYGLQFSINFLSSDWAALITEKEELNDLNHRTSTPCLRKSLLSEVVGASQQRLCQLFFLYNGNGHLMTAITVHISFIFLTDINYVISGYHWIPTFMEHCF